LRFRFNKDIRSRSSVGVAAVAVCAVVFTAGAAQAAPSGIDGGVPVAAVPGDTDAVGFSPVPTIQQKVDLPRGELERLRADGQRAEQGSAVRSAQPQSGHRPAGRSAATGEALSPVDAERIARAKAVSNPQPADSAPPGDRVIQAAPIGEQPNGGLVDECFNAGGADRGIGRVHNRFTYCLRVPLVAEYWEVDDKGVPVKKAGTTKANLEVFAQGDDTERRQRVFARFQKGSVDFDWGPIDNLFTAPNVPESLIGQCVQNIQVCHATRGAATLPWVVWDNNTDWFYWDVFNHEDFSQGRDKISYHQWFVETFTNDGKFRTVVPGRTARRMARCDSATYFTRGTQTFPKACIFSEVIPHLQYELGSDHGSVAFHIFTAQFHPNLTYPLLVPPGVPAPRDKRIPGKFVADDANAPGLHRITTELHPGQVRANGEHKDGACFKTGPFRDEYLDTGLPVPPNTPVEQCDEYPFASTLEGAAHPFWDFSVKAVPQRDNSVAGGLLGAYYINDRVLAWDADLPRPDETNDRFYVHIK
jgi:hypothetical protein